MTTEDRPEPATPEGGQAPAAAPESTTPTTEPTAAAASAAGAPEPAPEHTAAATAAAGEPAPERTPAAAQPAPDSAPAIAPVSVPTGATAAGPLPLPSPEPTGDAAAAPSSAQAEAASVVPDVEPGGPSPVGSRARGLLIACVALFVLSVGLGILTAVLASKLDREVATRDDVEETAGRFATALLTYHFEDLDRSKQAVLGLSTGKFRREYEQAFNGGLDVLITETKATSEGTVTDVFVSDVEEDTATAIVVADVRVTGTAGERRGASSYIQLELVRVAGRWRVDGVTNLNFGQNGTPTGVPSTPETTTTAPPR